ncbi:VOC family protein [Comamonas endophytica]|uniref:Glyoxalase n=1 Tax=Comamonas endophytica TaxID=2949090 RepID=A0ABY6G7V4_9BURK|nr:MULTISPECIES: VOC family protein [unclassified Acidovorax]MCD2514537.1 glyoxalase [Acidovorax sp. D4N7]UYG51117.1 glyoxalase [Acidovorax sp. 5MLIR]
MTRAIPPFHLAFPVNHLDMARHFYRTVMGCPEGRSTDQWIDFDFYGHQIVTHLVPGHNGAAVVGKVDGHGVSVPHFGVVLDMASWEALVEKLRAGATQCGLEPCIRFMGLPGEQATMFFKDPSGNAIEIEAFASLNSLFAK